MVQVRDDDALDKSCSREHGEHCVLIYTVFTLPDASSLDCSTTFVGKRSKYLPSVYSETALVQFKIFLGSRFSALLSHSNK